MLDFTKGKGVSLEPISLLCWVNGVVISQSTKLNQGKVCMLCVSSSFRLRIVKVFRRLFIAGKSKQMWRWIEPIRTAREEKSGAKPGKTCNRCQARENV